MKIACTQRSSRIPKEERIYIGDKRRKKKEERRKKKEERRKKKEERRKKKNGGGERRKEEEERRKKKEGTKQVYLFFCSQGVEGYTRFLLRILFSTRAER